MQLQSMSTWPKELKMLTSVFLLILSIGFFSGLTFVGETSSFSSNGIEENYLGNEANEDAEVMKFKKSERHMLSVVHSHILSMSVLFFVLALLLYQVNFNLVAKKVLMVEPLISVLTTFGGIYFLWKGILWMKYVVMISGVCMTISYTISVLLIFWGLFKKNN